MIIWLNGAFGAGKTQTACELHRRLPGSYIYDPENAGYFIRQNIPAALHTGDFQDYPMWRAVNYDMLDYICQSYGGDVIVPMTITNRAYYDQIVGALSEKYSVKHLILYAGRETLLHRLSTRFETERSWAARQIDRCIKAFNEDILEHKIYTDALTVPQVAEQAAFIAGVTLAEDRRSAPRRAFDRIITQYKHIR